jgi:hypothetical protein
MISHSPLIPNQKLSSIKRRHLSIHPNFINPPPHNVCFWQTPTPSPYADVICGPFTENLM